MADEEEEGPEPVELGNGWYQYEDEEGRHYFYNTITEVTQWEMPAEEELVAEDEEEAYSDCPVRARATPCAHRFPVVSVEFFPPAASQPRCGAASREKLD